MPHDADESSQSSGPGGSALLPKSDFTQETFRLPRRDFAGLGSEEFNELLELGARDMASKQERDFILAALLIRGKHLGERVLRKVLKGWTPFGEIPLRDYLLKREAVSEEIVTQVEQEGREFLKSLIGRASWSTLGPPARRTSDLLERIDPSGRVAKLLGFSQIRKGVTGTEVRSYRQQFRLLRKLGQGGLGTVWLALDMSLNRYVALKEILGSASSHSPAVARFRREAEITGRLDHPSIVPVHVLGENDGDGRLFYVMRFLGNETLEDAIRDYHERREAGRATPLAFHRLLNAFVSACQAIAYAHSRHVIHRDLKPQNIALDSFGQVIILDWGLAKALGMQEPIALLHEGRRGTADQVDMTMAGQVMGTPMYMAPEQAAGRIDEIDEQTDVYGLGAILFAILTGYAPHELSHDSLAAGSQVTALLDVIVERPAVPPRQLNPDVPSALNAICLKAMSHDRYRRYASAAALSDDLQRWIADEPVSAVEESPGKRLRRWIDRNRRLSQLGFLVLVVLSLLGGMWGISQYRDAVAAAYFRTELLADDARLLQSRMTHEMQTLAGNARFMSSVPPVYEVFKARVARDAALEAEWTERLRRTYRGLLDANPSYAAVTYWIDSPGAKGAPIRVLVPAAENGPLRADIAEFMEHHLPEIAALSERSVYIGMPGAARGAAGGSGDQEQFIGRCMLAGIGVFDPATGQKIGGVVIECSLEGLFRDYLAGANHQNLEILLVDGTGRSTMQFNRKEGLQPSLASPPLDPAMLAFLRSDDGGETQVFSPKLSAARITLNAGASKKVLGLLLRVPD